MFAQAIRSMFFPQKRVLRKPRPGTIKNNYSCADGTLEWHIKNYLNKQMTAGDCLQGFIEHMAYDDALHIKENEEIFPMVEDLLEGATWKTEWDYGCENYNPSRPEPWLRCVHSIYGNKLYYIREAERLLEDSGKEITAKNIAETTAHWGTSISEEDYLSRDSLQTKAEYLRKKINSGDFTPKEALIMIKDNWELLYPYQSSYEAIEYCVAASENHAKPKYFDSAFRDFGYKMGELYRQAKEK